MKFPVVPTSEGMVHNTGLPGFYTATGYRTAEVARKSGRPLPSEASADLHLRRDRELLGNIAEQLDRDNGIYECVLNRSLESILGPTGIGLDPETPSPELNAKIKADWKEWGKRAPGRGLYGPEARGLFSWRECEQLALRSYYNRGDIGVHFANRSRLIQYVESPRIAGGRRSERASREGGWIEDGVELDANRRPVAYWVSPRDEHGRVRKASARRRKASDFLLWAHRKRFSQTRGVPVLGSVLPLVHRVNDILDSEAIAWQALSRFAIAITREGAAAKAWAESKPDNDGRGVGTAEDEGDVADRFHELDSAIVFHGEPGESVKGIERNLPGSNFTESIRTFFSLIGAPFGVPGSVLMLDFRGLTYTANRAEIEQAFRAFHRRQQALVEGHHAPIYEHWLGWQIALGRYPDDPSTYLHRWRCPQFPWVDRLKESQAWKTSLEAGVSTQSDALASTGRDHEEWLGIRAEEIRAARQAAARLNAEDPESEPVHWYALAGLPISRQQSMAGSQQ